MRLHEQRLAGGGFLLQVANFRRRRGAYYVPGVIARHMAGGAPASFAKRRLGVTVGLSPRPASLLKQ